MVLKKLISRHKTFNPNDYIIALDIGTEYVKTIIAKLDDNVLNIVGVGKSHQDLSNMHSGAIADISGVVRNCEEALNMAEKQAGLQSKNVVIGIAGELVKGVTNTIRYRRPQADRPLDATEMEFIIEKVQARAQEKAQKQIGLETGNQDIKVSLVNSALVSIHIDGYKISNPIGFLGRDISIQIYTAFAPMIHIGALERVALDLSLDLLAVAAEPFAVSRSVLGSDVVSNFTAILVDVGGGTTDIAVVNDGGVEGTQMFGIGGRSFTNTIASELAVSYKDAEKLKVNLETVEIKQSVRDSVNMAIEKALDVWVAGVELALSEFDSVDHLPSRILLCGGGASLKKLVDRLSNDDWYRQLAFTKRPIVHYIKPSDVIGINNLTNTPVDHTFITAMGLLRVGHDTIRGSQDESIKDKFNRLLRV